MPPPVLRAAHLRLTEEEPVGSDQQVAALAERAEDDAFAQKLHQDPIGTLRGEGYDDFASDVEQELTRIDGLLRQILGDDDFRQLVEEKPTATLSEWGLPEPAIEPVLALLGAPEDVIERASAEVEAHGKRTQVSAAAAAAVLGALAFAQSATAATPAGLYRGASEPQAQIQPNPLRFGGPEGIRWGANPEGIRGSYGTTAQGIKWGANPDFSKVRFGHPDGVRWYLASLRRAR
jgi:hypothetical protein